MNQENTLIVYTPTIKGTSSAIEGVNPVASFKNGLPVPGAEKFDVRWNPMTKKVEVRAIPGEAYQKGFSYKMKFEFELADENKLTTGDVAVKPVQSKIKHNLPKQVPMYQGRTGVLHKEIINLAPTSPAGAKIETLGFKAEKTDKNGKITKHVNNPNDAYWYYFDKNAQQLHIWSRDGALVKPGKSTLVFSVTYEGQGTEKIKIDGVSKQAPKPVYLKIPVIVSR